MELKTLMLPVVLLVGCGATQPLLAAGESATTHVSV